LISTHTQLLKGIVASSCYISIKVTLLKVSSVFTSSNNSVMFLFQMLMNAFKTVIFALEEAA